jgi:outer membrane protein assembly factor BamB
MTSGSIIPFKGHPSGDNYCIGDVMALNSDGTVLFVGYHYAKCVVACNTEDYQPIWTSQLDDSVTGILYHSGMLLVAPYKARFLVLNAADGTVIRRFFHFRTQGLVLGLSVITGLLGLLALCF